MDQHESLTFRKAELLIATTNNSSGTWICNFCVIWLVEKKLTIRQTIFEVCGMILLLPEYVTFRWYRT